MMMVQSKLEELVVILEAVDSSLPQKGHEWDFATVLWLYMEMGYFLGA